MPVTPDEAKKLQQTGTLLAVSNALLWPLYYVDKKLGVSASVVATLIAVGVLHQMGKNEQAKSRAGTNANALFSSKPDDPIKEAFDNVLAGGAKVSGLLTQGSSPK